MRQRLRKLTRTGLRAALAVMLVIALLIALYRFVPVPLTPLMVLRWIEGEGLEKQWVDYDQLSPNLRRAVIAAEDARFCQHYGFDFDAIGDAWDGYEAGGRLRGASTITQQTAKNLVLWPGSDWLRKIVEIYPTVLLELLWPKQRILQTYLNIVEWGHGIYGAEAAARFYFDRSARTLTASEAALMAAVLPNPRRWSPARPTGYIRSRAATILARMSAAPKDCP
jgi:monofunctional biosynthetic peptidoglycan transglycosylase